jgi:hypothetical protein
LFADSVTFKGEGLDEHGRSGRADVFAQSRPEFVVIDEQVDHYFHERGWKACGPPARCRLSQRALIVFDPMLE